MRILFIGDIVGRPGRKTLSILLPQLKKEFAKIDFIIVNGENAAAGKGLTEKIMNDLFDMGVDGITSGNHIWDRSDFYSVLDEEIRVVRPANYPPGCPGQGVSVLSKNGKRLALLNLQGRVFMPD
ncbi:YmdB family metallophosphoesterase, partial [Aminobacterium sp. UBA5277]